MTFRGAERPRASLLPDGRRLHLQHGPIDLVIGADGGPGEVSKAYRQGASYFRTVLEELVGELDLLRQPCSRAVPTAGNEIARHMQASTAAVRGQSFATPMIAVAGAVADHVLRALLSGRQLDRAYVNNGGDIALWLGPGAHFDVGVCSDVETGEIGATIRIGPKDAIGGIATSGWRGRSFSLGIADAVTVLARDAATADAATTLIANAVDVPGSPHILRRPATELAPDSDLGGRPATVAVERLPDSDVESALQRGHRVAVDMVGAGQIRSCHLSLQGRTATCAMPALHQPQTVTQPGRMISDRLTGHG